MRWAHAAHLSARRAKAVARHSARTVPVQCLATALARRVERCAARAHLIQLSLSYLLFWVSRALFAARSNVLVASIIAMSGLGGSRSSNSSS